MDIHLKRPDNPDMLRALIPGASSGDLMRATGKEVSPSLTIELTCAHEAGHAIVAESLLGFMCEYVDVKRSISGPGANTPRFGEAPAGNEDLLDLAGLYAELRWVGGELGYSHAHLQNATYDLDRVRSRLSGPADEVRWAKEYQPLAQELMEHVWGAVRELARTLAYTRRLDRRAVRAVLEAHKPTGPTPHRLRDRLKPDVQLE